jgi:cytochrome bd-type quinol oxidase subunit 2
MSPSLSTVTGNVFLDCVEQNPDVEGDSMLILQCISDSYEALHEAAGRNFHALLLVVCGAMIFFMQTGFAMLCAGSVRLKNVQNTMLKNLLDACGAAMAFFLVGMYILVGCLVLTFIRLSSYDSRH